MLISHPYLKVFDFNTHSPLMIFGEKGTGDGQFDEPRGKFDHTLYIRVAYALSTTFAGVAIDDMGNIIVADTQNNRVQVFDAEGKFLRKFGSRGSGFGQFDQPWGVAIDKQGHIVVSDMKNCRIQIW